MKFKEAVDYSVNKKKDLIYNVIDDDRSDSDDSNADSDGGDSHTSENTDSDDGDIDTDNEIWEELNDDAVQSGIDILDIVGSNQSWIRWNTLWILIKRL